MARITQRSALLVPWSWTDGLKSGDRVRVLDGPFAGYEGVFDARLPGNERVRVLLEMLAELQDSRRRAERRQTRDVRTVPLELNAGNIAKI